MGNRQYISFACDETAILCDLRDNNLRLYFAQETYRLIKHDRKKILRQKCGRKADIGVFLEIKKRSLQRPQSKEIMNAVT